MAKTEPILVGHLDCFSGVSGDMLLGAMLDAGLRLEQLKHDLARLRLPSFRLTTRTVHRGDFRARLVTVVPQRPFARPPGFSQITRLIRRSRLPAPVIGRSIACLEALGDAEQALHGRGLPDAFRGLELIDTLVDIVGAVAGLERLGVAQLSVSPVNLGGGMMPAHGAHGPGHHHGPVPLPAPAAVRLLTGYPVYSNGPAAELTTPTGAALIRVLARGGSLPPMRLVRVGHGAGHRRLDPWPNLVRLFIGESIAVRGRSASAPPDNPHRNKEKEFLATEEEIIELETHLDDYTPQFFDYLRDRLFAGGALDVYLTPVIMKQGRPATQVTLLARPERAPELMALLFDETTTLGVRAQPVRRWTLPRRAARLATPDGPVRVKLVQTGRGVEARPEYRDARAIAERTGQPIRTVMRRLEALAQQRFGKRARSVRPMGGVGGSKRHAPPDFK